jgi:conjugative relaxase-like TrwC/TraI family protein
MNYEAKGAIAMLSFTNVSAQQAENYYKKDDAYAPSQGEQEPSGITPDTHWHGSGASRLNLIGEVEPEVFQTVLYGSSPSGELLSARRIDPTTRRAATDFTFSAPKSVSIAALVQGDFRVLEAHDQAIATVLDVMEERYIQTRIRTDEGQIKVQTDNLVAAVFRHQTSREQDPQLHSHALVMNCTQKRDRQWQSLSNEAIVYHSKFLGQTYQNELAHQLSQIGYGIAQRQNGQFELKDYEPKLLAVFSTRRQQVEAVLEGIEHPTREQRERAALTTRKAKTMLPPESLHQSWDSAVKAQGLEFPAIPHGECLSSTPASLVVLEALAHCTEQTAVFHLEAAEKFVVEQHTGQMGFRAIATQLQTQTREIEAQTGMVRMTAAVKQELDYTETMDAQGRGGDELTSAEQETTSSGYLEESALCATVHVPDFNKSFRQKPPVLKAVAKALDQGDVVEGVNLLEQARCLLEVPGRETRLAGQEHPIYQRVVDDYLNLSAEEKAKTVMMGETNAICHALNQQVRQTLQESGQLQPDRVTVRSLQPREMTQIQAKYSHHYQFGDVLVPH